MDGDVRFQEHVLLGDISGDMVAVEHPMYVGGGCARLDISDGSAASRYPRHDKGWCVHGKITMCEYPYERKQLSTAYIPETFGKFKRELRTGEKLTIANSYYLQSAFWGGKSKFIIPCLKELKRRVDIDIKNNYISSIIQDERSVARTHSKRHREVLTCPHGGVFLGMSTGGFGTTLTIHPLIFGGSRMRIFTRFERLALGHGS